MRQKEYSFTVSLPSWIEEVLPGPGRIYPGPEERMRFIVELSRLNVEHGTGGPFAAGIFDLTSNTLLSAGVNLVIQTQCCLFHAEIVAILIAQQKVNTYDLGAAGFPPYELVTSTEPCAMCLGALTWSGVRSLICGARDEDARAIGFDEGPKAPDWISALKERGISVRQDICRRDAVTVLRSYLQREGPCYNARQG
ncbi:MAG: nucleoside deaminase [bacterium]